ncbi:nucleotidyltransferase family protein [Streptomyces marokkonensis]|uniref:nucleotidyltransferase domain-containing protein n=1 Tax=Streptomyces marokkonensis TaxID=324855 RepID=UPI0031E68D7F
MKNFTGAPEELSREARLVLYLSRPRMTAQDVQVCRDLLENETAETDWGRLVDFAGRNKILPLVGFNLSRHQLFHKQDGTLDMPYHYLFTSVYLTHRARNRALVDELGRVLSRIESSGSRYAVRKGPVVLHDVYPDLGTRRMTDLDLLVHSDDLEAVRAALLACGYRQGRVSSDGKKVEPFARRTQIFWRMNLNNELPYIRLAERDDLTAFTFDLCKDIGNREANGTSRTEALLERATSDEFCGVTGRRLAWDDHLMDLCLHLFKEATTLYYIENQADLQLQKFVDIAGSLPRRSETERWERLVARAEEFEAKAEVYFALSYTEVLFPSTVPAGTLDRLRPQNLEYLDQYGASDGTPVAWNRPFVQRLFSTGRRSEVSVRSKVPRT